MIDISLHQIEEVSLRICYNANIHPDCEPFVGINRALCETYYHHSYHPITAII